MPPGDLVNRRLFGSLRDQRGYVLRMTDSKAEVRRLLFVGSHPLRTVGSGARLLCRITRHHISTGHAVKGLPELVLARISLVIRSRSRGPRQIFVETSDLTPSGHGKDGHLLLVTPNCSSHHGVQIVLVRCRAGIRPTVSMPTSKRKRRRSVFRHLTSLLGSVSCATRGAESLEISRATVQRVMGCAILAVAELFGVGEVAGTGTAVVSELSVANTESISWSFIVHATRIMGSLANDTR